MPSSYVKKIKIDFNVNYAELKKADELLKGSSFYELVNKNKDLTRQLKLQFVLQERLSKVSELLKDFEEAKLTNTKEYIELLESEKKIKSDIKNATKDDDKQWNGNLSLKDKVKSYIGKNREKIQEWKADKIQGVFDGISNGIKNIFKGIGNFILDSFKNVFNQMQDMLKYDTGGIYGDERIKEENEEHGFSDAQGYGIRRALEKYGASLDDYVNGEISNPERQKAIENFAAIEEQKYNEMKESGYLENIAEIKEKFKEMRERFQNVLMQFLVENGDTIIGFLQAIMKLLSGILWFFNSDPEGQTEEQAVGNVRGILSSHTSSSTTNVTFNNSMSATTNSSMNLQKQMIHNNNQNQVQILRAIKGGK